MRRCEGVREQRLVIGVGHGKTSRAIDKYRPTCETSAWPRGKEPVGADRLRDRERGGRTAGVLFRVAFGSDQTHAAKVGFEADNETAHLKVIADLATTSGTVTFQVLIPFCRDRRHAGCGKVASWAEDGAGLRVGVVMDKSGVSAKVKTLEIAGARRDRCNQGKQQHAGCCCMFLHLNFSSSKIWGEQLFAPLTESVLLAKA